MKTNDIIKSKAMDKFKEYSKSGEYKLYKPFASWLIENDFCEHVTYWSRMIDTKNRFSNDKSYNTNIVDPFNTDS